MLDKRGFLPGIQDSKRSSSKSAYRPSPCSKQYICQVIPLTEMEPGTFKFRMNVIVGDAMKIKIPFDSANLEFTQSTITEIARIAHGRDTGARGLRAVAEQIMEALLFQAEAGGHYQLDGEFVHKRMSA